MQKSFKILSVLTLAFAAFASVGCNTATGNSNPGTGSSDIAATVNGKPIKNEEIEKLLKGQFQGQESKLSPLELDQARLQALDGLIQQEIMFQKAEKEKTLPTDEEVTQAINEQKQQSGMSADDFNKRLQQLGETEQSMREVVRKSLAVKKLGDKIAATVQPPSDTEVENFFKGNPELFLNKRGASFAAIVIDPADNGQGDTTRTAEEAALKLKELAPKLNQPGVDFAALVQQYSEDRQSAAQGGEWQSLTEEQMKQVLGNDVTTYVMEKMTNGQIIPRAIPIEGKTYILKLTNRQEKDENLTLETPNVKPRVINLLTQSKKQLLTQAYLARAMDEARIENFIAKRIVDNPNQSGARPADAAAAATASPTPAASPASASPTASASPAAKADASPAKKQ